MPRSRNSDSYVAGSRPKTRLERWEEMRTKCIPDVCMYAYICPTAGARPCFVSKRECFHHRPAAERPPAGLSRLELRLLASYRRERA